MTPVGANTVPLIAQSADIAGLKRETQRKDKTHDTISFFIGEIPSLSAKNRAMLFFLYKRAMRQLRWACVDRAE
jgi:hypothetical protein